MQAVNRLRQNLHLAPPPYLQELLDESETDSQDDYLSNASSNRTHTDVPFLILQGGFVLLLMFLLAYCIAYGDIDRLTKGYDTCGNVCGKINTFDVDFETCKAEDMRSKPFLSDTGECVETCDTVTSVIFGHRCVPGINTNGQDVRFTSLINGVSRDLHTCSEEITYMCLIALGLSFMILLVLRYVVGFFVWGVLIGVVLGCAFATAYCWYLVGDESELTPLAIFLSIVTLIILLVILVMRKRIQLVIQLFKEAGKSITAMPTIIFEPLLTFVSLALVWSGWIYFALWIESAGVPIENGIGVQFHQNGIIQFSRWYNHFVMFWLVQFIYGCQNMFLAGAVSTWYFTRNKARLGKPMYNSARNMIKYHLGTISCGSLIIALIHMLRVLFQQLRRFLKYLLYSSCLCCLYRRCDESMNYLEQLTKYLSRNAYIITSIHGYSFMESGSRAYKLLVENALRVLAINSVGDFVLVLAKVLVVIGTVLSGLLLIEDKENVKNKWAPLVVAGIVAYLIAHCFITVYEMAIDTIFICFCEDCEVNDGLSRPYFMSQGLMEFVEKSKSVLGIQIQQENANNIPITANNSPVIVNNPVIVTVAQNN